MEIARAEAYECTIDYHSHHFVLGKQYMSEMVLRSRTLAARSKNLDKLNR